MPWSYPLVRVRRFLTGFTEDRGGFKPKPNSQAKLESHCFANPPDGWSGREQTLKAPNQCHGPVVKSPPGAQGTLHDPPKNKQIPSWIWLPLTLQSPLHKTLYKRHPEEPASRGGEVGNDQRRKETAPACTGILTPINRQLGKGTRGKGLHNENRN